MGEEQDAVETVNLEGHSSSKSARWLRSVLALSESARGEPLLVAEVIGSYDS
jgi:hypothetical protein